MGCRLATSIEIDAKVDRVWSVLADLERWHEWNPFVTQASGTLAVGERLRLRIEPPGGRPMTFRPTVTALEAGRHLAWTGRLLLPKVFDGHHRFHLEGTERGTLLRHEEDFDGVLVGAFRRSLDEHTRQGFELMNAALEARVADQSGSGT